MDAPTSSKTISLPGYTMPLEQAQAPKPQFTEAEALALQILLKNQKEITEKPITNIVSPVLPPKDKDTNSSGINAENAILGTATTVGYLFQTFQVGGTILETALEYHFFEVAMARMSPIAWSQYVQYACYLSANHAAKEACNMAFWGVTAGTAATAGLTLVTALTAAEILAGIHNTFYAKTEEDKVSISLWSFGKKVYSMLPPLVKKPAVTEAKAPAAGANAKPAAAAKE